MASYPRNDESRVLVIYTGGTIGMLDSPQGYVTYPRYIYDSLRAQTRFHDPQSSSLHANSLSVDNYKSWSSEANSRATTPPSPTPQQIPDLTQVDAVELAVVTFTGVKKVKSLVMPRSPEARRIRYAILEYDRLIDSSEIEVSDYLDICHSIQANYQTWDGFVVLHGTDTMAYSASALSFLLEHLGKPVILTGAQIPLSSLRNDAVENLLGALMLAGNYNIPEVTLYFNHTLFRGNRSCKRSSVAFDAFETANLAPLVSVGIKVDVRWDLIERPKTKKKLQVHTKMCQNVTVLRLFPSMTAVTVKAFLAEPTEGVVLETYGAGNAPQKPALLKAFKDASDRGVVIVNVSQCARGTVSSEIYATGRALAAVGIVGGRDMTTECALAKLAYLLSKPELSRQQVRDMIGQPLRGELTLPVHGHIAPIPSHDRLRALITQMASLGRGAIAHVPLSSTNEESKTGDDVDMSVEEVEQAHQSLLPILVAKASSRNDQSLSTLLNASFNTSASVGEDFSSHISSFELLNNQSTPFEYTPLHIASNLGLLHNVETLLSHGASVHLRDSLGHTALFYAASRGSVDVVKALVKVGACLGEWEIRSGEVALKLSRAQHEGDQVVQQAWQETGVEMDKVKSVLPSLFS